MKQHTKRISLLLLSALFYITAALTDSITAYAMPGPDAAAPASTTAEYEAQAQERKNLPIQSNEIESWPEGPSIGAQSAILLEANTGVILYAKNIHEELYPASTTKLMTCLLAIENSSLDETVTFSYDAVHSIESGSSNIGMDAGQAMSMEECLYGILVASANEVANAVAEHIAGSMDAFADLMNARAAELGCENTHFVNAHGLFDENHYTSAYDLALIAQAFFQNEQLAKIGNTPSHHFVATATQPDDFISRNKHKLITGEISCDGIRGGKTGYTDEARQTLVTCAEKNGMKLICVIMKEESPEQFNDTVKLLDYGFSNFTTANVSENESGYQVESTDFFHTSYDIFGNSESILSLNQDSYIILPKTLDFSELTSEISYDTAREDEVARINYSWKGCYLGTAALVLQKNETAAYDFESESAMAPENVIFINVKYVLIGITGTAVLLILIFIARDIIVNYNFLGSDNSRQNRRRRRRWRRSSKDRDLRF